MTPKKASVLVVDDDIRILRMIKRMLELEGYQVFTAGSGQEALDTLDEETQDIILLDIMMPDIDGYTVCQRIREFSQIPIIMVTAKGADEEKIKGLDAGADDYVTKPFSASELAARVRAALRRTKISVLPGAPVFRSKDLLIDFVQHRAFVGNEEVNLSSIEYRILCYLALNAGRVITHTLLLDKVWGSEYTGDSHLLHVSIARIRQKIGDDAKNPAYILTRPGIGYMLLKPTEEPPADCNRQ